MNKILPLHLENYPASLYIHDMRDILFKYLNKNYTVKDGELFDILNNIPIKPYKLLKEFELVFGINEPKELIKKWVSQYDVDIDWSNVWDIQFPYVRNVEPTLLGYDVVGIDPITPDSSSRFRLDDVEGPDTCEQVLRNWARIIAEHARMESLVIEYEDIKVDFNGDGINVSITPVRGVENIEVDYIIKPNSELEDEKL
ncbi:MAG: hypothetical protein KAH32_09155 [Chlamydiia bacterium]|nr:hypothetical protein [Chlamydiia bacterium]